MQSSDMDAPVRGAYNQGTQFESFPPFMDGVKKVRQLDDTHLHWIEEVNGKTEEGMPRPPSRRPTGASHGKARLAPPMPA